MIKTDSIDITYDYLKSLRMTKNTLIENDLKWPKMMWVKMIEMMLNDPIWLKT